MTEELQAGAVEAPVAEDLRSTIEAAVEKARAPEADAAPAIAADPAVEADKPVQTPGEKARDAQGRFTAAEKAAADAAAKPVEAKAGEVAKPAADATAQAPVRAPVGWSVASKAKFDALPPEVKADIAKREVEVNNGLAKLAEYKPIERFSEMAKQGGTTLETALTAYTNMETLWRKDPIAGVEEVCKNLNLSPQALVSVMAQRYGFVKAANGQQPQANGNGAPAPALPKAVLDKINNLDTTVTALQREREAAAQARSAESVDSFFNDPKNKYAENVAELMAGLIKQSQQLGRKINLPEIYEQACWMHPEVRELLVNERIASPPASTAAKAKDVTAQARAAAKATTGAPASGLAPGAPGAAPKTVRDAVLAAVEAARGA